MASFLEDLGNWIMGVSDAASSEYGSILYEKPITTPRNDKVVNKEYENRLTASLQNDTNALLYHYRDKGDLTEAERANIDKKLAALSPSERLRAQFNLWAAHQKESQGVINNARALVASVKDSYEKGEAPSPEQERDMEYRNALNEETGVYGVGDLLGTASVVSQARESGEYYDLIGENPLSIIFGTALKGEVRNKLQEVLMEAPVYKRAEISKEVARRVAEVSVGDVGFGDQAQATDKILKGEYSSWDRIRDNVESLMNLAFFGEVNALTKGGVAITKPFAKRFAGYTEEAAKNTGFLKFLFSNESERMAEEGAVKGREVASSLERQEKITKKGTLNTLDQAELNSERSATRYNVEKNLKDIRVAEEYFGWKNGSTMSPVDGGVIRSILDGSDMALKDSFLKASFAADRFVTNALMTGSLKELKLKSPVDVVLDQPSLIILNDLSKSRKTVNVENVKESLSNYGYFKQTASEIEKDEIAETAIKKLQESGYYFLDNKGRIKTGEVSNLKNKITNIDVSTGELHLKNPEQVVDLIELGKKEKAVENLKTFYDKKSKAISRKLDGDWDRFFDRTGKSNKSFNTFSQMNPLADNSGAARAKAYYEAKNGEEYTSQGLDKNETLFGNSMPTNGENIAPMDRVELAREMLPDLNPEHASSKEIDTYIKKLTTQLEDLNASNVDISVSGTEQVVKCRFSGEGNSGYETLQEAKEAFDEIVDGFKNIGLVPDEIRIVGADLKGNLEAVQEGVTYSKYYLEMEHRNDIAHKLSPTGEMIERTAGLLDSTKLFRWFKKMIPKASVTQPNNFMRPLMAGFDRAVGFRTALFSKDAEELNSMVRKLNGGQQERVFNTLFNQNLEAVKASRQGNKFFGYSAVDLREMGLSDAEMAVISKVKDISSVEFEIKNLVNARKLSANGYKAVDTDLGSLIGKEINTASAARDVEDGVLSVLDIGSGKVINVANAELENYKLFKFATGNMKYFVAPKSFKPREINWHYDQTIGKLPGYTDMRLKEGLIYVEGPKGNTVGVTDSIKKAEDYIDALRTRAKEEAEAKGETFDESSFGYNWRTDRLSNIEREEGVSQASLMQSRDGIQLINVSAKDAYVNPLDAMTRGLSSSVEEAALNPLFEHAKRSFEVLYRDVLRDGVFPSSAADIIGNSPKANAARSFYDYFSRVTGAGDTIDIDKSYKAFVNYIGNNLGEKAVKNGGAMEWAYRTGEKAMYKAAKLDPLALSRRVTSAAYIQLSPIRQFFLQGAQFVNAFAVDPLSAHKLLWQVSTLALNSTNRVKIPEGMQHMADVMRKAGFLTMESNVSFISDAVNLAKGMKGPFGRLLEFSSHGAILGEKGQILFTACANYNKKVREFGEAWFNSRRNMDQFIQEVRIITGSQSPAERMPWENGLLGAVFQFAQSPWKMNQILFNRQLPLSTRLGITANELLVFGAGVYGTRLAYDNLLGNGFGVGLDEDTRYSIEQGLFGMLVSRAFGCKFDTNNFSPTNINDLVGWFVKAYGYTETEAGTWMAGNWTIKDREEHEKRGRYGSGNLFEKALNVVSAPVHGLYKYRFSPLIYDVMSLTGRGKEYDPKTIKDLLLDVGRIASGFNAAEKGWIAYTTGKYLDSRGAVLKEGVSNSAAIGIMMGLRPETTPEERKAAKKESAWKREDLGIPIVFKSTLKKLNKDFGEVNDLDNNAMFKRYLEAYRMMCVMWVDGDPYKQQKLDKFFKKELDAALKGHRSDAYVVTNWIKQYAHKSYAEFNEAYNNLKERDPEKAEKVLNAINRLAKEIGNTEE